jgi:hypothetical protein
MPIWGTSMVVTSLDNPTDTLLQTIVTTQARLRIQNDPAILAFITDIISFHSIRQSIIETNYNLASHSS